LEQAAVFGGLRCYRAERGVWFGRVHGRGRCVIHAGLGRCDGDARSLGDKGGVFPRGRRRWLLRESCQKVERNINWIRRKAG
jgi:hypothetical protein